MPLAKLATRNLHGDAWFKVVQPDARFRTAGHLSRPPRFSPQPGQLPMALIVQKFGGSSVADIDRIRNVANRVAEYRNRGDQVVVVVSAMKGVTDNLIDMAKSLMPVPSEREMDMLLSTGEQTTIALLAIALQSMDIPAASLTGAQAGIVTDGVHSKAKIRNITPRKSTPCSTPAT